MNCRIGELRNKEVVNMKDGGRLGFVSDVELDTAAATLPLWWCMAGCGCSGFWGGSRILSFPGRTLN